jgi:hypothetical protein
LCPAVGPTPVFEQLSRKAAEATRAVPHSAQDDFRNFLLSMLINFIDESKSLYVVFI